jgi:pimeloyl-ACP methyl ester carboxylesterase
MKLRHIVLYVLAGFWVSSGAIAAESSGRLVELPTMQLWIIDSGGPGEPVILLHPRTGNSEFWQYTVPALAKAGYRAVAIDNPGWGKSIVHKGQASVPVAETLDVLFDHLGLDKVHVVGTAMGGYTAVDYAAWRPERVKSLVIAASGLGFENDPVYTAFRERAAIPGFADQPSDIREVSPNYRGMNPQGVARWKEIYNNGQQEGAARPPLMSPNTPEKLASIRVPTLVIAGGMDLTTPSGGMRLWSRHLKASSEFIVIPEAGHVLVWEQPEVFNQTLINFLQRL